MMERPTRIMKLGKQLRTYKKMSWKLRFWNEKLCSFFSIIIWKLIIWQMINQFN